MCLCMTNGSGRDKTSDVRATFVPRLIPYEPQMLENVQPSRMAGGCNQGAAAEADTIGEQQLKWMQSRDSISAQRAAQHRIAHAYVNEGEVAE